MVGVTVLVSVGERLGVLDTLTVGVGVLDAVVLIVGVTVGVTEAVLEGVLVTEGVLVIDLLIVKVGVIDGEGAGTSNAYPTKSHWLNVTDPVIRQSFCIIDPKKSQSSIGFIVTLNLCGFASIPQLSLNRFLAV